MPQYFHSDQAFSLTSGAVLPSLNIAYETYGQLNAKRNNVVWVCHALTANAAATDWWPGFIGPQCSIDTEKYFVICANILGSCYGSTGPLSMNPATGNPYFHSFPLITIRDMVAAHILLRQHLNIPSIHLLLGGSMGGYQVLEWALMEPQIINNLFVIASSARESAWGIAIHTAQRLAIEADSTWLENTLTAGSKGLKAARAIGMISYRNYAMYEQLQQDPEHNKTDQFKASSYINYQGDKLVKRFNAYSYWQLSKSMDAHNIARGRHSSVQESLQSITQPALIMGISSDILCPLSEQENMAIQMPHASFKAIESAYGHDGFLLEVKKISDHLVPWLEQIEQS